DEALIRAMHKTIKKVSEGIEGFKFNTAIAGLMEFTNAIYQAAADKDVFTNLLLMLAPIAPHFCEELWAGLGNKESIFKAPWPKYDPKFLIDDIVPIVLQVNGKVRSKIEVPVGISEEELKKLVLSDEKLKPWIADKAVKSFIIVPKKLVNIVV
ncbi:MAG: class I tRNA ligase family protein, partial [Candidatus Omnitrophica bacterium]|nr:class I tRNA ligase family protein [Candidatus Omnitrophota bacterium]